MKRTFWLSLLAVSVVLSACVWPESEDPFERLPEEATETLMGEIFPFSVSVSTRATHRLERDDRLEAYLASDIVRLDDFVGQRVEVDGVRRTEKMREIFWVDSIRLQDLGDEEEEITESRFSTKRFTFVHPIEWEHSTSPTGQMHFIDKNDPARRVFLVFSVEPLEKGDLKKDPNVLIANMAGVKEIKTDELDRERQEIELFSNLYDHKYHFVFTGQFEEFEKKKAFFRLLNGFIEGEENVLKAEEDDLKAQAERESERLRVEQEEQAAAAAEPEATEEKGESLIDKLFGDREEPVEEEPTTEDLDSEAALEAVTADDSPLAPVADGDFTNLIDAKAFSYESSYYKFRMQVPWGFWFRNFGQSENAIARIGFSDADFSEPSGAKFWLEILGDETPPTEMSEKASESRVVIEWPRSAKSFFRLSGPAEFRDAMKSIQATVAGM